MRKNKYIVLLLGWMYVFPSVYQSIHIFKHHFHSNYKEIDTCCKTDNNTYELTGKHKKCPICDYTFFIKNLPTLSVFQCKITQKRIVYNEFETERLFSVFVVKKSQRAPPVYRTV